jgi:aminoglycoside phosphotransferase (APT) family kinase protein
MEKGALIGAGRTADVYAWGGDRILKLFQAWMPADSVEGEFTITRLAREAGLPVPAAEELVEVDGRPGIIFERVHGPSMLQVLEKQPGKVLSIARQLAELHVRMHAGILPEGPDGQHQQIERGVAWAKGLTDGEKQAILDILARLPKGNAVCHGDFHPDNILITGNGPVIIDWMTGTRGNPLGDVSRTVLLIQAGGLPPRIPFLVGVSMNALRRVIVSAYLKHYRQLHPASLEEIASWKLPIYAARLAEVENYPAEKASLLRTIRAALAGTA